MDCRCCEKSKCVRTPYCNGFLRVCDCKDSKEYGNQVGKTMVCGYVKEKKND